MSKKETDNDPFDGFVCNGCGRCHEACNCDEGREKEGDALLLTDEAIERMSGDPLKAQAVSSYEFGKTVGMARGLASARNIYETARQEDAAKIARLEGLVQEVTDALVNLHDTAIDARALVAGQQTPIDRRALIILMTERLAEASAALSSAKALDITPKP